MKVLIGFDEAEIRKLAEALLTHAIEYDVEYGKNSIDRCMCCYEHCWHMQGKIIHKPECDVLLAEKIVNKLEKSNA